VPTFDEKTETDEKIYTSDGDLDIGHHNIPGRTWFSPKMRVRETHP
jgi:hypothetical protein